MGRPNLSTDSVASLEIEFADLGGRDVDIIWPRQVVVIRRAEEAVAVGKNLEYTLGENVAFLFALRLEDLENKILLTQTAGPGQIQGSGDLGQLGNIFFF